MATIYITELSHTMDTFRQNVNNSLTNLNNELATKPVTLADLTDTSISTPASGQFLRYNGTAWINETVSIPVNLNDLADVAISSPATGNFLRYNGSAWVNEAVSIPVSLNDLSDVTIATPSSGQFLRHNGTNWVNESVAIPVNLNDLGDVSLTSPTAGQVLQYDGTAWVNASSSVSLSLDDLTDVTITTPASRDLLIYNSTSTQWENGALTASDLPTHTHDAGDITTGTLAIARGGTGLSAIGTANQLLGVNSGATGLEYKTLQGTANQITVAHAAGSVTLSTPQDLHTGATPTFASITLSSLAKLADGSAAAPSLTFTNDTDTGLYRGGADNLRLVTGGSVRVVVDSAGKVGINQTTPTATLHVVGTAKHQLGVSEKTANYTLVADDNMTVVKMNAATALTLTVPASVFAAGDRVTVMKYGAGNVTISAGTGLTLRDPNTLATISTQYDTRTIVFLTATEAVIV